MINISSSHPPEYSFEPKGDNYQIIVNYDFENIREVKKIMMEEAKKSSLMGMAFINSLAERNNPMAKQVASLYEGYRTFFVNRDKELLLQTCQSILDDQNSDEIAQQIASYVINILKQKKTIQSDGKIIINHLIPFIKQMLLLTPPKVISCERVVKIPEMEALHNAFPDLIKFNNYYYACFREAKSHVEHQDLGKIRILRGHFLHESDEWQWENCALLTKEPYDLRDPKFFIDSKNQLRLIFDGSIISEQDTTEKIVPHVAYEVKNEWKVEEANVDISASGDIGQWLWRVTWNPITQAGYGFSYGKDNGLSLMKTTNGVDYEKITEVSTPEIKEERFTEATIRFKANGNAVALVRTQKHGLIGTSCMDSDYTSWSFNVIPFRLGGPNFVFSKNEDIMWAGTRHLFLNPDNTLDEATIIALMDEKRLIPLLRLQSNLDSGYPGMVLEEDGSITVLYYSSEPEKKSNIYITRVSPLQKQIYL